MKARFAEQAFSFLMIRTPAKKQRKGSVQLDLFVPYEQGFELKVIVTNKDLGAATVVNYHKGRGSQEGILEKLKLQCHPDYETAA